MYQDRLDACPTVVAFFTAYPGSPSCIACSSRCMWFVSRLAQVEASGLLACLQRQSIPFAQYTEADWEEEQQSLRDIGEEP